MQETLVPLWAKSDYRNNLHTFHQCLSGVKPFCRNKFGSWKRILSSGLNTSGDKFNL